jgi:opacity protein-like surface antigen
MKKMLKIMAMLLIIATVVFAAGCSSNKEATTEKGATEQVTESTAIASHGGSGGEDLGGASGDNITPGNNTTEPEGNFTPGNNSTPDAGDLDDSQIPDPEVEE